MRTERGAISEGRSIMVSTNDTTTLRHSSSLIGIAALAPSLVKNIWSGATGITDNCFGGVDVPGLTVSDICSRISWSHIKVCVTGALNNG